MLLYSHLCYLNGSDGKAKLSDTVLEWILSGKKFFPLLNAPGSPWIEPGTLSEKNRRFWRLELGWRCIFCCFGWVC